MHSRNIKEWKNSLRLYSRAFRESMDPAEKEAADGAILRRLLSLREYRKAEWIYTYVSKPIEVNTLALIENALRCRGVGPARGKWSFMRSGPFPN